MSETFACPEGYYCSIGSISPEPCPTGSYNPDSGRSESDNCILCPKGSYCNSEGLPEPTGLCPNGYNCDEEGIQDPFQERYKCQPGHHCYSTKDGSVEEECSRGSFNPREYGNDNDDCLECTPGKACTDTKLIEPDDECGEKYYCQGGADRTTPSGAAGAVQPCGYGYYCEAGSPAPLPCPDGTYDDDPNSPAAACSLCPAGRYCNGTVPEYSTKPEWDKNPFGADTICPAGHFCNGGTVVTCPRGSYNERSGNDNPDCTECDEGYHCPSRGLTGIDETLVCEAGFFCDAGSSEPTPADGKCPMGSYCEGGLAHDCLVGTVGTAEYGVDATDTCIQCPGGHYCDTTQMTWPQLFTADGYNTDYECDTGHYCNSGCKKPDPSSSSDCSNLKAQTGGNCGLTKQCPAATMFPLQCNQGFYQNTTKAPADYGTCERCDAGYECDGASGIQRTCPKGKYCEGTSVDGQLNIYECSPGTYNSATGQTEVDACIECREGYHCTKYGMTGLADCEDDDCQCAAGFYCSGGTIDKRPTDNGSYCTKGNYCPVKSSDETACPVGKYCNADGLDDTDIRDLECAAGYWCESGAKSATPYDDATNEPILCPAGYYCEQGTEKREPCDDGKFSYSQGLGLELQGLRNRDECLDCPAGYFCRASSNERIEPELCREGYYCEAGASETSAKQCEKGHRCPEGSAAMQPCPAGSYADKDGMSKCEVCLAGKFCPQQSDRTDQPCGQGSYCPAGTGSPIPCPPGTFGNDDNLESANDCQQCPEGYYCDPPTDTTVGLTEYTTQCDAGYECIEGAVGATPMDGVTGILCPVGYYCPNTATPQLLTAKQPCPVGTYGNKAGAKEVGECQNCPAGFECNEAGISDLTNHYCPSGYYCLENQDKELCQVEGKYCPSGTGVQDGYACPDGKWSETRQDSQFNDVCTDCPRGYVCDYDSDTDTTTKTDCPSGFYCLAGSSTKTAVGCPASTFGPTGRLWDESQCKPCPEGFYCPYATPGENTPGDTTPSQDRKCFDGFACNQAAVTPSPDGTDGINRPCETGHYCKDGIQQPCPSGTYMTKTGTKEVTDCLSCPAGYYCPDEGMSHNPNSNDELKCKEGYYCFSGSSDYKPNDDPDDNYGICPEGHYCPTGTPRPIPCEEGKYVRGTGNAECSSECNAGYFCPIGSSDPRPQRCPHGYYCDEGTTSYTMQPCPKGTYDPTEAAATEGLQDEAGCVGCPKGKFCPWEANTDPNGDSDRDCEDGFICANDNEGSWSSRPYCDDNTGLDSTVFCGGSSFGNICKPGFTCDGADEIECPENKFCPHYGLADDGLTDFDCAAGYHCTNGATIKNPSSLILEGKYES